MPLEYAQSERGILKYQTVVNLADDGFQKENTTFAGLQLFAAIVRVLRTAFTHIVQNVFAQPYQNDTVRIRQCSRISAE